jgi:hypothetical protein
MTVRKICRLIRKISKNAAYDSQQNLAKTQQTTVLKKRDFNKLRRRKCALKKATECERHRDYNEKFERENERLVVEVNSKKNKSERGAWFLLKWNSFSIYCSPFHLFIAC